MKNIDALTAPPNLSISRPKGLVVGFWVATALFCLQMAFTAYAELRLRLLPGGRSPSCSASPSSFCPCHHA